MATDPEGNQNVDNLPQGCSSFGGQDWEFRGCSEVLGFGSTNLGTGHRALRKCVAMGSIATLVVRRLLVYLRSPSDLSLRVQVPNNHILTQNLYYNHSYPKPIYLIIIYLPKTCSILTLTTNPST